MRGINEECGVFGIFNHNDASKLTYFGLHSLQHRGQEGAGIVSSDGENLYSYRNLGLVSEVFKDKELLYNLVGSSAIGHVRYATAGDNSVRNVQPFLFDFYDMSVGICQDVYKRQPLFLLDYIATGKLVAEKMASIVEGVAEGCIQAGSALIGGETAEMPGIYLSLIHIW